MDLLCVAYADAEDVDNGDDTAPPPPPKRPRSQGYHHQHHHRHRSDPYSADPQLRQQPSSTSNVPADVITSRYISKRERAAHAAAAAATASPPLPTFTPSPVVGSISNSVLPQYIMARLNNQPKSHARCKDVAGESVVILNGHDRAANSIQWSHTHCHLLASAGMDDTLRVWNVWSEDQKAARVFRNHKAAVKDVKWCMAGLCLLSCGYDCSLRLFDVERGIQTQQLKADEIVEVIKFHPRETSLFVSGGSKGFLKLWDIRVGKVVNDFRRDLGPILDIEFSTDGRHLISSSDTSNSRISENSIIVWDVQRQIPLSNQVYVEGYTCPCIRYHPSEASFIAQSNGNYIAIFSARPPFKLDKYKRYQNHGVWGFPIKCNFSLDGEEIVSGSSDGFVYFFSYKSSKVLRKKKAFNHPCVDVAFHPVMPGVLATCSWSGEISVFQ